MAIAIAKIAKYLHMYIYTSISTDTPVINVNVNVNVTCHVMSYDAMHILSGYLRSYRSIKGGIKTTII